MSAPAQGSGTLVLLLELGRKARRAQSAAELAFLLVNETHALIPYRQAALWLEGCGVECLSSVVQVEANTPYVQWLDALCQPLAEAGELALRLDGKSIDASLGAQWAEWLPAYGLWIGLREPGGQHVSGGLLLARDLPWGDQEIALLGEWVDTWHHLWYARQQPARRWFGRPAKRAGDGRRWWQRSGVRWGLAALVGLAMPVKLTVLAPGELVPARPAVIRAPLDGVIDTFHIQPNQLVRQGEPLFGFDEILIQSRLEVARQALATAEAEYRQTAQQALMDPRAKAQLSHLTGKIEERRAEVQFAGDQLSRARVSAPRDGIALFDDPSEWIGRPVSVGERIMRIALPGDVEVEAWIPVADAIPLQDEAGISLHVNASPLDPVRARLRYLAHEAVERPDGSYAYRLRATLDEPTPHRVGLKGTARVSGRWVPLGYWMARRPLASLRAMIGL